MLEVIILFHESCSIIDPMKHEYITIQPYCYVIRLVHKQQQQNKNKWMTVSLGSSLASEGICLFVDLWEAQPCLGDPE